MTRAAEGRGSSPLTGGEDPSGRTEERVRRKASDITLPFVPSHPGREKPVPSPLMGGEDPSGRASEKVFVAAPERVRRKVSP